MPGPAQNRVTPLGEIVAVPLRCAWMGNRGILHDRASANRREVVWASRGKAWIICALEFRGRRVEQWATGRYTPLFLHDEAVALAAGHRPCFQCRYADATAYRDAIDPGLRAPELDARLHTERGAGPHPVPWRDVPVGAFVHTDGGPALVREEDLVPWTTAGYGRPTTRPTAGSAQVMTPVTSLAAIRGGFAVQVGDR